MTSSGSGFRRVLVLVNAKSGFGWSFDSVRRALDRFWDRPDTELTYQFSQNKDDSIRKVKRAVENGFELLLVVGGDGTVSTAGTVLMGTEVALGVIPVGSGNGFARHFRVPLAPEKAVRALATGTVQRIDVAVAGKTPFLVTCSMAWDAAIIRTFEKFPVRGIAPYIFAGVYEFFDYRPQRMTIELNTGEKLTFPDPLVFTIANLTEYGGGARIAPHAKPDDGQLELIAASRRSAPQLLINIGRFFDGTITRIPDVVFRRFQSLMVKRQHPAPIQIDGELVDAPTEIEVTISPKSLNVLAPLHTLPR